MPQRVVLLLANIKLESKIISALVSAIFRHPCTGITSYQIQIFYKHVFCKEFFIFALTEPLSCFKMVSKSRYACKGYICEQILIQYLNYVSFCSYCIQRIQIIKFCASDETNHLLSTFTIAQVITKMQQQYGLLVIGRW